MGEERSRSYELRSGTLYCILKHAVIAFFWEIRLGQNKATDTALERSTRAEHGVEAQISHEKRQQSDKERWS